MTNKERKLQKTIRFERDVVRAATERSRRIGLPYSVVLANAAREALLAPCDGSSEAEFKELRKSVLSRLNTIEQALGRELVTIRELLALLARTYLNHTPDVSETEREAASMSGRLRFARLIELLQRNVGDGVSILDEPEPQDVY